MNYIPPPISKIIEEYCVYVPPFKYELLMATCSIYMDLTFPKKGYTYTDIVRNINGEWIILCLFSLI